MSRILQITDTHLTPEGALLGGVVDTAAALSATVRAARDWLDAVGPVDLAVVTGDLAENGLPEEYARFRAIMEGLALPVMALPGNHDRTAPLRAAFADQGWIGRDGPVNWLKDLEDFAVLGLDSHVEGAPHGALSAQSLAFIDAALPRLAERPLIVALHHPPFPTGIGPMDRSNVLNGAALLTRLAARAAPTRLICGHLHRLVVADHGGVTQIIAPGASHAVRLDYRPDQPLAFTREPPAMMLHEWRAGGFVSHLLPIPFPGPGTPFGA